MMSGIELIIERACKKALPKIQKAIEENKAKKKHLKRVRNRARVKR